MHGNHLGNLLGALQLLNGLVHLAMCQMSVHWSRPASSGMPKPLGSASRIHHVPTGRLRHVPIETTGSQERARPLSYRLEISTLALLLLLAKGRHSVKLKDWGHFSHMEKTEDQGHVYNQSTLSSHPSTNPVRSTLEILLHPSGCLYYVRVLLPLACSLSTILVHIFFVYFSLEHFQHSI